MGARSYRPISQPEQRLRLIADAIPMLLSYTGTELRYRYNNKAYEVWFRRPLNTITGRHIQEVIGTTAFETVRPFIAKVLSGEIVTYQGKVAYKDGGTRYVSATYVPHINGRHLVDGFVTLVADITQRRETEQALRVSTMALRRSREELRALTAQLMTAQEQERRRISRDLHDDVNQRLGVLAMEIGTLQNNFPTSKDQFSAHMQVLRSHVVDLSNDVRQLAYQLHSSVLDDLGLPLALQSCVRDFGQREGIPGKVMLGKLPSSIPHDRASCLYRVTQEALSNVRKHAQATQVTLSLNQSGKGLNLCIIDNGIGFDIESTNKRRSGLGLISMQERIRLVNGRFMLKSRPGQGSRLQVWVPNQDEIL